MVEGAISIPAKPRKDINAVTQPIPKSATPARAVLTLAALALLLPTGAAADDLKSGMKTKTQTTLTQPVPTPSTLPGTVRPAPIATADTSGVAAERLDGPLITVVPNTRFEVLGVVERDGDTLYEVPAQGGVFLNHVPQDLFDISTNQRVVDEYSYEYNGRTYTNRVVRDFETLTYDEPTG